MRRMALVLVILGALILAVALVSWAAFPVWRQTPSGFWLVLAAAATGVVALIKGVLDILKRVQELGQEEEKTGKPVQAQPKTEQPPASPPSVTGDHEAIRRALTMARRTLAILEEQAAGYTALTIPAHVRIELEEKRREVGELEVRLKDLEE